MIEVRNQRVIRDSYRRCKCGSAIFRKQDRGCSWFCEDCWRSIRTAQKTNDLSNKSKLGGSDGR
jgi:hypothetical protein